MEERGGVKIVLLHLLCCGGLLVLLPALAAAPALLEWLGANAWLLLVTALAGAALVGLALWRRRCTGTACGWKDAAHPL